MRQAIFGVLCAACVLMLSATASAQTSAVLNPTTVEFPPSPDHTALEIDGVTPVLTRYELRMALESAPGTAIVTADLGKPTPVAGKIAVTNPVWFAGLTPRTRYVGTVASIGPGGVSVSGVSNPFGMAGPPAATPPPLFR